MASLPHGNELFISLKISDALKAYKTQLESDPTDTVLLCNYANACFAQKLLRRALKTADSALKVDPKCLRAFLTKANIQVKLGKKEEALDTLRSGEMAGMSGGDVCILSEIHSLRQDLDSVPSVSPEPSPVSEEPAPKKLVFTRKKATEIPPEDPRVGVGYYCVNTGKLDEAIETFNKIIEESPKTLGAYLGRGSAYALKSKFTEALNDFKSALQLNPHHADAHKRRAQVFAAMGKGELAMREFNKSIELDETDIENYTQMASLHYKLEDFRASRGYLEKATELNGSTSVTWNMIGLCENALGNGGLSIAAYERAIELQPNVRVACGGADGPQLAEAHSNLGQTYRNQGLAKKALKSYNSALKIHTSPTTLHLRSLLRHGTGRMWMSRLDACSGLQLTPRDTANLYLAAVCEHALGRFDRAVELYTELLRVEPDHMCNTQVGWATFQSNAIDTPLQRLSIDAVLENGFKEAFSRRWPRSKYNGKVWKASALLSTKDPKNRKRRQKREKKLESLYPPEVSNSDAASKPKFISPEMSEILGFSDKLGSLLQYNSPGFLANCRQHCQFGLAVVEIAQTARELWRAQASGTIGTGTFRHRAPSRVPVSPYYDIDRDTLSVLPRGHPVKLHTSTTADRDQPLHGLGWREMADVGVLWRQLSEPFDPVFWIDLLPWPVFAEGFGLQTAMVQGQGKVFRYYPYYSRAFAVLKRLLPDQYPLTEEQRRQIEAATTLDDIYEIMKRDFWVVLPCHSSREEGLILEGTRLTLQKISTPANGFDFTVRTPGTPHRWVQFDEELSHAWEALSDAAVAAGAARFGDGPSEGAGESLLDHQERLTVAVDAALRFYYYFVCFAPLSRGTSAVGSALLNGFFRAMGLKVAAAFPLNFQLDWEAILALDVDGFIHTVHERWLNNALQPEGGDCTVSATLPLAPPEVQRLPRCWDVFDCIRKVLLALNTRS